MKALKTTLFLLGVLVLATQVAHAGKAAKTYVSPDKGCQIIYEGAESGGEGVFYDITGGGKKTVRKVHLRIGPIVNWMSNSVAEIQVSEGSPSYHSYYYDCREQRVSPPYSLPIAFEPTKGIIAALEQEEIVFYRLFSEKAFHRAEAPGVGLMEYFGSCDAESAFESADLFRIQMTCEDGGTVDLRMRVPGRPQ